MVADDVAFLQMGDHNELVYVGPNGSRTECFGYQPNIDDISERKKANDRYCVQLVGDTYEVYDLKTLKVHFGATTVGLPVFTSDDPDAAIMWALMTV